MALAYPCLEKIYLKRMCVTDSDLILLSQLLLGFKELVLDFCEGFGTNGLASIASNCRQLRVLDLIEDVVTEDGCDWISCFPEAETCLECLNFDCIKTPVNFEALELLVARSPFLKKLRLNQHITIEQLHRLMIRTPQIMDLGTGSFISTGPVTQINLERDLSRAFANSRSLVSLSGFSDIVPEYLHTVYPVCANLLSLNFSYTSFNGEQFKSLIQHCHKLQKLWVLDTIGDEGLQDVATICKELCELRVFPFDMREDGEGPVSEEGLLSISEGCRKLQSILYFCHRMTNAAVVAMSRNCPELKVFRLCMMGRHVPDHLTGEPMDEGFGAIVMNCKKLTRLAVSGLLTDKAFSYIGKHGKLLRTLSVAFAGDSDRGLRYVLEECPKLEKLEIRDSPFGDAALFSGLHHYYKMRFVWMSSCRLTLEGCKEVARRMPQLVVEVIMEPSAENITEAVDKLYMYRSLDGRRTDTPEFVSIL
ncbi:Transport inhibitor response 1-like protein [Thalictrum thalictroides]|uniref:Transport inhibitor response 1-like protein n=1 Tax=Thalictrum thalictroides TaxID=46969 RepID=A0A7J6VK81_THATH|nr:Transport inhibitor response 1-like protein [Thalictrum thalictroides]